MQLKDEKHRTETEARRWSSELSFYRRLLRNHLEQLSSVQETPMNVLRENMTACKSFASTPSIKSSPLLKPNWKSSCASEKIAF